MEKPVVRVSQFLCKDGVGSACGVVAVNGQNYPFTSALHEDGWSVVIDHTAPSSAIEAVSRACCKAVVILLGAGARVHLTEFDPRGNRVEGTLEITEDGATFPIACCDGEFCRPADLYGDEHLAICQALKQMAATSSGELTIEAFEP